MADKTVTNGQQTWLASGGEFICVMDDGDLIIVDFNRSNDKGPPEVTMLRLIPSEAEDLARMLLDMVCKIKLPEDIDDWAYDD